jgi:hypothetical protein
MTAANPKRSTAYSRPFEEPSARVLRALRRSVSICLLLCGAVLPATAADEAEQEAAVRAAFLYRLAFYITWPDAAFADAAGPIRICLASDTGTHLARAFAAQAPKLMVNARPLEVAALKSGDSAHACHIVYLGGGDEAAIAAAQGHALVVVDSLPRLDAAGQLALVREVDKRGDARLVFYARKERLEHAEFSVSYKLMQLVRFHEPRG